ncbi:YveK family protein [Intestinibacter bartlettii]|jgi:capsular polysaccharide biosynthesis protein|uniref:YveK family protein n=1 Tax=Intestinibacter bartlettii TaxID=261299 RepID=UPI002674A9F2|nr:hypothetical protein [Intestinibacter bartlettii]MDU6198510.1 hypothetical protein [Intestinibacter bartlettii]
MQEAVNIREYLDIFKRRKWIIIILVFASLVFGGYKTYKNYISYVPTYTSTVTVRINTMKEYEEQQAKQKEKDKQKSKKKDSSETSNSTDNTSSTDLYNSYSSTAEMRNQNIASSYVGITTKEQFRKKVAAVSGVQMSQIGSVIATQNADVPTFVDMKIVSLSPEIASKVAQAAPDAFNQELIEIAKVDCVEVVYEPTTPALIPRSRDLTLIKCLAVGIALSIFIVLLVECLDTRIKTPNDVAKYWDLPLIGVIPMDDGKTKGVHEMKNRG